MKKRFLLELLLYCPLGAMLLCSCSGNGFLAGSSDHKEGGICFLTSDGKTSGKLHAPTLNYLIRDQRNPERLYATLGRHLQKKSSFGAVAVIKESFCGTLSLKQCVSVQGRGPCHLTLSPDRYFLYTANYSSGDISELPLDQAGKVCGRARLIRHTKGSVTPRQKGPHPHYVSFDPAGKQLYVCDLGSDEIVIYDYVPGKGIRLPRAQTLSLPGGSGPRHLVFAPDGKSLYCANELNSTILSFTRKDNSSFWKAGKIRKTQKANSAVSKNYPGAIRITADGKFFFVTNRGENTLGFFETLPNGDFRLLDTVPSGGDFPGDILLFPNGKDLAVIHLKSGNVTMFELDGKKKRLLRRKNSYKVRRGMTLTL